MKQKIGLVPPGKLFEDDVPHRDQYLFGNVYAQRIVKHGALPVGVLPVDGYIVEDTLDLCDGFLIAGGSKIWPYHLQMIEYAIATRKPLLGICLGMQAIAAYFHVKEYAAEHGRDLLDAFAVMKQAGFLFNHPVENHYLENVTRGTAAHSRHPIAVQAETRLYEAIGRRQADAVSLHSYRIASPVDGLTVSALAPDGTIEGIEYDGFVVGVQFHPEVEDAFDNLFAAFADGRWLA